MRMLIALGLVACVGAACGSTPIAPTPPPPPVPACQTNNTADLALMNQSQSNYTLDVLIDGIKRATLAPGQTSMTFTLAAGVAHSVVSRVTNTSVVACTASPVLAQCSSQALTCKF